MMVMKLAELEHEIEKLKAEKKHLVKKHLEEMKARDGNESRFFCVLCACVLVYACLSMISRIPDPPPPPPRRRQGGIPDPATV
jgi:hypothetical protein